MENDFFVRLLANVSLNPRSGHIYSNPCPTAEGLQAKNTLITQFGWTATCNPS